ncbi:MAG TPA: zinc ribbon domain-containing protein [Candidatus Thermoplasmatota archaeon]|nr:zinc ribbon domain-containing protein [Candidatus Thermoplasmatota archaeon]
MSEGRLTRADLFVQSLLLPREWVCYLRVGEEATGETVVALTSHRILQGTLHPEGRRGWRSLLWRDVTETTFEEAPSDGQSRAYITVRAGPGAAPPVRLENLDPGHGRTLFQQIESLRLGNAPGPTWSTVPAMPWSPAVTPSAFRPGEAEARPPTEGVPDFECTSCGEPVQESYSFCPACGAPTQEACRSCGHEVQTDFTVCPYCAAPLIPSDLEPDRGPSPEGPWVDFKDE